MVHAIRKSMASMPEYPHAGLVQAADVKKPGDFYLSERIILTNISLKRIPERDKGLDWRVDEQRIGSGDIFHAVSFLCQEILYTVLVIPLQLNGTLLNSSAAGKFAFQIF